MGQGGKFREKGTIFSALSKAEHHLMPSKVKMIALRMLSEEAIAYRFNLVTEQLRNASNLLQQIKEAAGGGDLNKVRKLLAREFEFGHEYDGAKDGSA